MFFYSLALTDKEICSIYQQEVLSWLLEYVPESGDIKEVLGISSAMVLLPVERMSMFK